MTKPYKDIKSENFFIREFSSDTPTFELVWHRDKKDRVVEAMHDTDWMFQMDNEIPKRLTENKLFIPKETYHRLLKGTGNLKVKIYEM
jgi:hypothetical protein